MANDDDRVTSMDEWMAAKRRHPSRGGAWRRLERTDDAGERFPTVEETAARLARPRRPQGQPSAVDRLVAQEAELADELEARRRGARTADEWMRSQPAANRRRRRPLPTTPLDPHNGPPAA